MVLEDICTFFGDRVRYSPIQPGESTENYSFQRRRGRQTVVVGPNGEDYSDLDYLLVADGLPVLFEVKIKKYRAGSNRRKAGTRGVVHAMKPERVDYLLAPLREYFGTDCGYVLIVSNDQIARRSTVQRAFKEQNGILVPYYTDRTTLSMDVSRVAVWYDLHAA
jgi:hypothetical protein